MLLLAECESCRTPMLSRDLPDEVINNWNQLSVRDAGAFVRRSAGLFVFFLFALVPLKVFCCVRPFAALQVQSWFGNCY